MKSRLISDYVRLKMVQGDILKKTKTLIKRSRYALRTSYMNTFYAFDTMQLKDALRTVGVGQGQIVLAHSSFDAFEGFQGKASSVVETLEELLGPEGTLLMPSLPFGGTAIDYIQSGKITDIARTPSRNGLLTELFRRQKGTLRSIHPTHPVLARGKRAEFMLAEHERATTPCGEHSPFAKLLEVSGKILLLGTDIETMTFFHHLEERFESRLEHSPFTTEVFDTEVKVGGELKTVQTRLFDKDLSIRRSTKPLLPELQRLNGIASAKVGRVEMSLIDAGSACKAFEACLDSGKNFYE